MKNLLHGILYMTKRYQNLLHVPQRPGPSCSKLTTMLVNVSLKFQISQICQFFLCRKKMCEAFAKRFSHFSTKNFSVFGYKVVKHLTS